MWDNKRLEPSGWRRRPGHFSEDDLSKERTLGKIGLNGTK